MSRKGERRSPPETKQGSFKKPNLDELLPDLSRAGNAQNLQGATFDIIDQFNLRELKSRMIVQKLARVKAAQETNTDAQAELKKGPTSERGTDSGLAELSIDLAVLQGMPEKNRKRVIRLVEFWKATRDLGPKFIVPAASRFDVDYPQEELYTQAEVNDLTKEYVVQIAIQIQERNKAEKEAEDFHLRIMIKLLDSLYPPQQAPARAAPPTWSGDDIVYAYAVLQIDAWLDQYSAGPKPDSYGFGRQMSPVIQRVRGLGQELYSRILTKVAESISSLEDAYETNDTAQRNKLLLLYNFALHLPETEYAMVVKGCKGRAKGLLLKERTDPQSRENEVVSEPS